MKTFITVCMLAIFVTVVSIPIAIAQTNIYPGEVTGKWKVKSSPYYVLGEITIPDKKQLKIDPGVQVVFMGHYKFNVGGTLLAIGTQQDPIVFTAADTEVGWHGIRFMNTPIHNDSSQMVHCSFKYGNANTGSGFDRCGGAMLINGFDKVLVSNCLFEFNMQDGDGWDPIEAAPAIYIYYASPVITNSSFSNNTGSKSSAITCVASPKAIISDNVFSNNVGGLAGPIVTRESGSSIISGNTIVYNQCYYIGGGIAVERNSSPRIEDNIIFQNYAPYGGGICCGENANAVLISNNIVDNYACEGGGILCARNSNPIFINNIIYSNRAYCGVDQVYIDDLQSDPHFLHCDIEGGEAGFGGYGSGSNYTGIYENNIDADPLFVSSMMGLSDYSPCIGAGIGSIQIAGQWYHAPGYDMFGLPRPSPSGTMPDIGAVENVLGSPLLGFPKYSLVEARPKDYSLEQNYPNPFNPSTTIRYELPKASQVTLRIFNAVGQEVATLVDEMQEAGYKSVTFDASNLASGVYFYRIQAGDFVASRKLLLLK